jgi:hypothetical protein
VTCRRRVEFTDKTRERQRDRRDERAQERRGEARGAEYYGREEDEASKTAWEKNQPSDPLCRLPCTSSSLLLPHTRSPCRLPWVWGTT